ncbi:flavodoxin family protein [Maritalea mediterranea]|uniref:NAD(P)H-dependent oxidoreductase n=1 Tax=Maritalea mediterranea TaxID=2909667 RepID=A0ABS9E4Y3_9HYPH|nr:NAD(P)H-dependent oxidoreductase [Maritalea mediterranea]MCF4097252.1 NAD(P)H-dependent oxidoreductase [Maritalea mediterranea]
MSDHKGVVILRGSPRAGGNSDQMADRFANIVKGAGRPLHDDALRDLNFVPFGELPTDHRDDLSSALAAIYDANVVVLSTPIYFCNISGLLKGAFDRFFGYLKSDYLTNPQPTKLPAGKHLVLLQVQGEPAERYGDLLAQYGPALDKLGFKGRHLVRACGVRDSEDIQSHPDVLQAVEKLATRLITS